MSWERVRLADIVSMKTGKLDSNAAVEDGDYPFFTCSQQTLRIDKPAFDTEAVLLGGNNAAGVFPLKYYEGQFNAYQRTYVIESLDPERLSTRFLFYSLRPSLLHFQSVSIGATTQYLTKGVLNNFAVALPSIELQRRISSILSAYDDLIENNRRRIQLLEQAARLLYKEWFVHLRFPGHEHVKIKDGVPEGWGMRRMSDIAMKIGSGATPRGGAAAYQLEGVSLIRSQNIYDYRFEDIGLAYINEDQANKLSTVTVEPADILLNITGASVGRCCMVPRRHLPARVNQHVMIIRIDPKQCSAQYVMHFINSHQQKQMLLSIARAGGATREALTKDIIQNISILIPPVHLMEHFEGIIGRFFDQQQLFAAQNSKLSEARDLLLPRLMNGEIAV